MEKITNETIFSIDWAKRDRQKALSKVPRENRHGNRMIAGSIDANKVCGVDVSGMDPRSVKASLRGRGDFRVFWWNLNVAVHRMLFPRATMESIMYAFHKRHHFLTLTWLQAKRDVGMVTNSIATDGIVAGYKKAAELY